MAMDNPSVQRWQYQKGPLYGKGSVEDAVYAAQEGHCLFCAKGIDHYHHVVPRRRNGSETLENRAGLCEEHHRLVHTEEVWAKKLATKKDGLNKKYHALSVLNQIIPSLTEELAKRFPEHFTVTTGRDTYAFREDYGIPKDHYLDAYCIACSAIPDISSARMPRQKPYDIRQFRRHDRQACHKANIDRKYVDAYGKVVAVNRNKAMEQKTDSLTEYRKTHSMAEVSQLSVKEHAPQFKDRNRPMPGSLAVGNEKVFVLTASDGRHNGAVDYYVDEHGEKHIARKCRILTNNNGLQFCG